MSKTTATLLLVFIVILTFPIFFITIPVLILMYNGLVKKKNRVELSYSGIDVMLKKRFDLVLNLVSSVKMIMTHESQLFEKITALRSSISQVQDAVDKKDKRFALENELSQSLGALSISMENYPELKSNTNMMHLQRTLNDVEEQISASRRAYNSNVVVLNDSISTFPSNVMASFLEYKPVTYFQILEQERNVPNVGALFG